MNSATAARAFLRPTAAVGGPTTERDSPLACERWEPLGTTDPSTRERARVHSVHRCTVRDAQADLTPPRLAPDRESSAMGQWPKIIRVSLLADLDAPRKQRQTVGRVWQPLADEHGATVAESTVTDAVATMRRELVGARWMSGSPDPCPGAEAEVGFGELRALIGGIMANCSSSCSACRIRAGQFR